MLFVEWFVPVLWIFLLVAAPFRGSETTMFHKVNLEFLPFLVCFGLTGRLNRVCQLGLLWSASHQIGRRLQHLLQFCLLSIRL